MSKTVKVEKARVTTGAFELSYTLGADENIEQYLLNINTAPTSAGSITVTLDSREGAEYDTVLYTADPVAESLVDLRVIDDMRFATGDTFIISYANPDNRTVAGLLYHDPGLNK